MRTHARLLAPAAVLDNGLFRGTNSTPMATALRKQGGVTALVVGGCCELNADAHRLLAEIGALRGRQAARESGEGERACAWGFRAPATSTAAVGTDLEQLPEVYLCSGPVRRPHPRHSTAARPPGRGGSCETRATGAETHQSGTYAPCGRAHGVGGLRAAGLAFGQVARGSRCLC